MKVYGIIGYPLTHSFSKRYFTEKFLHEGISGCRYESFPIASVQEYAGILETNPGLVGLNVTIPHKKSILPLLDDTSGIPAGLDACNCIRLINGRSYGYNTDITGFERSLIRKLKHFHTRALVLGNGGAAEGVKFVLKKLGITYRVVSREPNGGLGYAGLDETIIKENLLIINTTPLGTFPAVNECADIPYRYLTPEHLLFDLVYNPEKTLFLEKGEEQGAAIQNGYDMLVIQAEESWQIWNAD